MDPHLRPPATHQGIGRAGAATGAAPWLLGAYAHHGSRSDALDAVGERDLERQRYLETLGFRVVRVTNEDVLEDLNAMGVGIGRIVLGIR